MHRQVGRWGLVACMQLRQSQAQHLPAGSAATCLLPPLRTFVVFQSHTNSLPSPSPLIRKRLSQLKAGWHA